MGIGNLLSATQSAVILAIKKTQSLVDKTELALASGKDVNSAIDDPQKYFVAKSLSDQAGDLMTLLDGISIDIKRINETDNGVQGILKLLDQLQSLLSNASADLFSSVNSFSLGDQDIQAILAANPGVTYSPATKSFYEALFPGKGVDWATANASAQSATLVIPPSVTDAQSVGGHLAIITSQEENDFIKSIVMGVSWVGGADSAVEGEWRWSGGPENGQQFWQGLAAGGAVNGMYTNWNAGEPNQSGNEDSLQFLVSGKWNDQSGASLQGFVTEWDSSLLLPSSNNDLSEKAAEYRAQYLEIMDQIDKLAQDSHYQGINLLIGNDLKTMFNMTGTSSLLTKGTDATSKGLGLVDIDFLSRGVVDQAQQQVRDAKDFLRAYSTSVAISLNVISMRLDFTQNSINTHKKASDDLVIADQNQKGAEMLALQVRQQLQFEVLSITEGPNIADVLFGK